MRRFSRMCQQLESVPFHRDKAEILAAYLRASLAAVPEREGAWALYLLLGGQPPRLVDPRELEAWTIGRAGISRALFDECRAAAADLAETVALLVDTQRGGAGAAGTGPGAGELGADAASERARAGPSNESLTSGHAASETSAGPASLTEWLEARLPALARLAPSERRARVEDWWTYLELDECWAAMALALGHFPVHLPRRTVDDALVAALGSCAGVEERLRALPVGALGARAEQLDLFGGR